MTDAQIGLLAAGSALFGALIGAASSFGVEFYRTRERRRKEVAERLLDMVVEYLHSIDEWGTSSRQMVRAHVGDEFFDFYWDRSEEWAVRSRRVAIQLYLVAPTPIKEWMADTYEPAVDRLTKAIAEALESNSPSSVDSVSDAITQLDDLGVETIQLLRKHLRHLRT